MLKVRLRIVCVILVLQLTFSIFHVSSVPLVTEQKKVENKSKETQESEQDDSVEEEDYIWPYRPKCVNPCRAICMTPTSDENLCCDNCYCDFGLRLCYPPGAKSHGDDDE